MSKVLIIDDEEAIRSLLSEFLKNRGFIVVEASDGSSGVAAFRKEAPSAVLLDYRMPGMDGPNVFLSLKEIDPSVPAIFLTAYADVHAAVEAMKAGAYDFLTKPADLETLSLVLKKAVEKHALEKKVKRLENAVGASIEGVLGRSEAMRKVVSEVVKVAASDFSVIIQGETGTGKSTVAELMHNASTRFKGPFVRVDVSAIPETLIESELFGFEKGAFTGADRSKPGYFEAADSGTLFIDELENMPPSAQAKLLGVVEARRLTRLGSKKPSEVDVRIITASNADLRELVHEKRFREDLYFRLNEFMITLPPLRERSGDISFLAERFLTEASTELKRGPMVLSNDAREVLLTHPWKGNVRELKNVIRRAALVANGSDLKPEHLDFHSSPQGAPQATVLPLKEVSERAAHDAERAAIRQALSISKGNKSKAAGLLHVDYKTLLTKIKLLQIE